MSKRHYIFSIVALLSLTVVQVTRQDSRESEYCTCSAGVVGLETYDHLAPSFSLIKSNSFVCVWFKLECLGEREANKGCNPNLQLGKPWHKSCADLGGVAKVP